jgi:hypothetical protein
MLAQGVTAAAPSRMNIGTPHWLTDREMQDIIGQVARGSDTKRAPKTPAGMMTAFDQVLGAARRSRVTNRVLAIRLARMAFGG